MKDNLTTMFKMVLYKLGLVTRSDYDRATHNTQVATLRISCLRRALADIHRDTPHDHVKDGIEDVFEADNIMEREGEQSCP